MAAVPDVDFFHEGLPLGSAVATEKSGVGGNGGGDSGFGANSPEISGLPTLEPVGYSSLTQLNTAITALDELCGTGVGHLSGEDLLEFSERLAAAKARLDALHSSVLFRIRETGDFKSTGSRTVSDYERRVSRTSINDSRNAVKRAEALHDHLSDFKEDLQDGKISSAHIDVLTRFTSNPRLKEQLNDPQDGAEQLRKAAQNLDAGGFAKRVKAWSIKHSPKQAEEAAQKHFEDQKVAFVESEDGWRLSGYLNPLNGTIVNSVLTAAMGVPTAGDPRGPLERRAAALVEICQRVAQDSDVAATGNGAAHITIHIPFESLVTAEARARLAAATAEAVIDSASSSGSAAPTALASSTGLATYARSASFRNAITSSDVKNTSGQAAIDDVDAFELETSGNDDRNRGSTRNVGDVDSTESVKRRVKRRNETILGPVLAEIRAGISPDLFVGLEPATLDDGTPLVPSELMALLCGSRISRQIFDSDGIVLDHGKTTRLCTKGQRRAVIARDGTCQFPGCDHTQMAAEIHHAVPWQSGGNTDIDNLIMLCWYHHQFVHQKEITIYRHQHGLRFVDSQGNLYTERGRERAESSSTVGTNIASESGLGTPRSPGNVGKHGHMG